jgi:hypothetical protein
MYQVSAIPRGKGRRITTPSKSNGPLLVLLSRADLLSCTPAETTGPPHVGNSASLRLVAAEHTRISVHQDANGGHAAQVDADQQMDRHGSAPQQCAGAAPNDRADHCCVPPVRLFPRETHGSVWLAVSTRRYFSGVSDDKRCAHGGMGENGTGVAPCQCQCGAGGYTRQAWPGRH